MTIPYQPSLRPELPVVHGAKDYRQFRDTLVEMDRILSHTGIEDRFIGEWFEGEFGSTELSAKQRQFYWRSARMALRYSILRALTHLSFRELARNAADSQIMQWFTHTAEVDGVRPISKSTAERFEKYFSPEQVGGLVHSLNQAVFDKAQAEALLCTEAELRIDRIFADTTCIKADIHFPIDWVLLRDAARTLIKAIILIRKEGLKNRMPSPEQIMKEMNKLCISMTHARKKSDSKRVRKAVLREMKTLVQVIEGHGHRYLDLLERDWEKTTWSENEKNVVVGRMRNILTQIPDAIHQAHERIIGERRVDNKDKTLSLYDPDIEVIVRGKAGADVEFGNMLYLAEQADGLIVDWEMMKSKKSDAQLVGESIERICENYGSPERYCADRGFDGPEASKALEERKIINAICPRSVGKLVEQLEDSDFRADQKRRGATEARVAIMKNDYLGRPMRSKGFAHRQMNVTWCVLAHNLWKLSSMAVVNREAMKARERAA